VAAAGEFLGLAGHQSCQGLRHRSRKATNATGPTRILTAVCQRKLTALHQRVGVNIQLNRADINPVDNRIEKGDTMNQTLADLSVCRAFIRLAACAADRASADLTGARLARCEEVATMLRGVQCHADRLASVLQSDARSEMYR
jgi:hypothetical protein